MHQHDFARSFTSIATRLNYYIIGIASVGGEERIAPYKLIMAQLQIYTETLSKIYTADKSEMVETNFRRLLEEKLKLLEEVQRRIDAHQAHLAKI